MGVKSLDNRCFLRVKYNFGKINFLSLEISKLLSLIFFVYTMIVNQALYDRVKARVMRNNPVHSAYRSGLIVKEYKRQGGRYSGPHPRATGLARWFRENWKSNTGRYGYTAKSSVYRPTKRITKKTPATFSELTPRELVRAKREKAAKGRVSTFLRGSTGRRSL